jgi:arsenate reductase (thioredoxin)
MKQILFVCIENSNRSQMAQAFANIYSNGRIIAYSAGSRPSGKINPKAIRAMKELGYDLSAHQSKSLDDLPDIDFEYAITMGCGDACPLVKAKHRLDWNIPDPRDMDEAAFREVRDLIRDKVEELVLQMLRDKKS